MANLIDNRLEVVGLQENPEEFAQELEIVIFGSIVPRHPGNFWVEWVDGVFTFTTKWEPPFRALVEVSKRFPSHAFLLSYGGFETQRNGQVVIWGGKVRESIERIGYSELFDDLRYPTVDLFRPHRGKLTLAQAAMKRIEESAEIVRQVLKTLDDKRFKNSLSTPYSDVRDKHKTEKVRAGLTELVNSITVQLCRLDFRGVLIEESDLHEGILRNEKVSEDVMRNLGLGHLVSRPDLALRIAILPFTAAFTQDPERVILPAIQYKNADPISGQYHTGTEGSIPPICWDLGYVCITPWELKQIYKLPDDDQSPSDIDVVISHIRDPFSYELRRASSKARWRANSEFRQQVEQKAIELSRELAAKVVGHSGVTLFNDLGAMAASILSNTSRYLAGCLPNINPTPANEAALECDGYTCARLCGGGLFNTCHLVQSIVRS